MTQVSNKRAAFAAALSVAASLSLTLLAIAKNSDELTSPNLVAVKTEQFTEKEGFERKPLDIINTLHNNDQARFQTLLEGLQQAFDLDNTLKNKGPYTLFAPTDAGFKEIPSDDLQSLFANKKKLKQVLSYHIVAAKLNSDALRKMKSVKTLEGHKLTISVKNGDLYVDKALVKITDIPCSNGIIHILDSVVMPPLKE